MAVSAQDLWEVITDLARMSEWVTFHRGIAGAVPRKVRAGTTFTQQVEVGGTEFEVEWEAREVEPVQRIVWEGCGPMGATARSTYELHENGDHVEFSYCTDFEVPGGKVGEIAARAVQSNSSAVTEESLDRLRRIVER